MQPKEGARGEKIWKRTLWVWSPCKPLKYLKTAKALFGKAWSETREFWRSLEKVLEGAFIPPPLAPAAGGLRSSGIVIARSEVAKQPRVAFVRKRRSNEAVRPAMRPECTEKRMARFIQGDRPEAGAELAMTGWKLARLFLGVALHGTASPASLIGFIQCGPLPLGRIEIRPTYETRGGKTLRVISEFIAALQQFCYSVGNRLGRVSILA